jgi:hypothetical protein
MSGETHKTASDLNIEKAELANIVNRVAAQMKLRQWCVEQVCKIGLADPDNAKAMTQMFYDFITDLV